MSELKNCLDWEHPDLSVTRQCELLGLNRSSVYYEKRPPDPKNLELLRLVDELYTKRPFYGSRRVLAYLRKEGHVVNRKRIQALMRTLGLQAVYPRGPTSPRPGTTIKSTPIS